MSTAASAATSIIGAAVPSARSPYSSAKTRAGERLAEDADPGRRAGKLGPRLHRAGLGVGQREPLREGDAEAGREYRQRREMAREDDRRLHRHRGEIDERAHDHHALDRDAAGKAARDQVADAVAGRKREEIEAVFGRRAAERVLHQEGRSGGDGEERARAETRLQHEGGKARIGEERAIVARERAAACARAVARLAQHRPSRERDRAAGREREPEHGAPSDMVGEQPAQGRREHRPERVGHGEIGYRLDEALGPVSVARHGAGDGDAAPRPHRLHEPPGDQHRDRSPRAPKARCRRERGRGPTAAPAGARTGPTGCRRRASPAPWSRA